VRPRGPPSAPRGASLDQTGASGAGSVYARFHLLDQARLERERELLRSDRRSIDEIAERLGYSDVANFTRAFRRWTGTTPAAHRRKRETEDS
jgi:AraC-like DNA-binding protein